MLFYIDFCANMCYVCMLCCMWSFHNIMCLYQFEMVFCSFTLSHGSFARRMFILLLLFIEIDLWRVIFLQSIFASNVKCIWTTSFLISMVCHFTKITTHRLPKVQKTDLWCRSWMVRYNFARYEALWKMYIDSNFQSTDRLKANVSFGTFQALFLTQHSTDCGTYIRSPNTFHMSWVYIHLHQCT